MVSSEASVSRGAETARGQQYCRVPDVTKMIDTFLDGNERSLSEFTDNVSTAFELTSRDQHRILLSLLKQRSQEKLVVSFTPKRGPMLSSS
jgi:hypothetical protein